MIQSICIFLASLQSICALLIVIYLSVHIKNHFGCHRARNVSNQQPIKDVLHCCCGDEQAAARAQTISNSIDQMRCFRTQSGTAGPFPWIFCGHFLASSLIVTLIATSTWITALRNVDTSSFTNFYVIVLILFALVLSFEASFVFIRTKAVKQLTTTLSMGTCCRVGSYPLAISWFLCFTITFILITLEFDQLGNHDLIVASPVLFNGRMLICAIVFVVLIVLTIYYAFQFHFAVHMSFANTLKSMDEEEVYEAETRQIKQNTLFSVFGGIVSGCVGISLTMVIPQRSVLGHAIILTILSLGLTGNCFMYLMCFGSNVQTVAPLCDPISRCCLRLCWCGRRAGFRSSMSSPSKPSTRPSYTSFLAGEIQSGDDHRDSLSHPSEVSDVPQQGHHPQRSTEDFALARVSGVSGVSHISTEGPLVKLGSSRKKISVTKESVASLPGLGSHNSETKVSVHGKNDSTSWLQPPTPNRTQYSVSNLNSWAIEGSRSRTFTPSATPPSVRNAQHILKVLGDNGLRPARTGDSDQASVYLDSLYEWTLTRPGSPNTLSPSIKEEPRESTSIRTESGFDKGTPSPHAVEKGGV